MKIITFATLKGGVGKTMTAFNIAGILSEQGKKILCIDVDLQGNLTNNFGIDRTQKNFKTIQDAFENITDMESIIHKNPIKELPTLDIIPSSLLLAKTERIIMSKSGRERILEVFFEENSDTITKYDYIIFDTNPSMSIINENAFCISDSIILLTDVDFNSLDGAEFFIALWKDSRKLLRIKDNVKGLIISNVDKRIKLSSELQDHCLNYEIFKDIVFKTIIPNNVKNKESVIEAKPINIYDSGANTNTAYREIINEMKERGIL